jgi:hypothetical protein
MGNGGPMLITGVDITAYGTPMIQASCHPMHGKKMTNRRPSIRHFLREDIRRCHVDARRDPCVDPRWIVMVSACQVERERSGRSFTNE